MKKRHVFLRFVSRAIWYRKFRSVSAILAIVLGTGVMGGLVNVYFDINEKMSKELRTYGANLLVYPADRNDKIAMAEVERMNEQFSAVSNVIGLAPNQYGVTHVKNRPVVLVGTWFDQIKQVSPYWNVEGEWVAERHNLTDAMVGVAVADAFDVRPGSQLQLEMPESMKTASILVKGVVSTGGAEDNQIFVSMDFMESLTGTNHVDIVLVSLLENGDMLEQKAAQLQADMTGIAAKPLKRMAQSEEKILDKLEKLIYLVAVVIFITTLLTVITTMLSLVMERRKEVGLKKALGASNGKLIAEFLTEGAVIGLIGSSIGLVFSHFLAQVIGKSVFKEMIAFHPVIIPWAYICSLVVIGIAFVIVMRRVTDVEPAVVLKGE